MSFQPYKTQTARQRFRPRAALSHGKEKRNNWWTDKLPAQGFDCKTNTADTLLN